MWAQRLEVGCGADDAENGKEHLVAGLVGVLRRVEDGAEDGEGQAAAVEGRRRNGRAQVLAHLGQEHGRVGRLVDEVDEEVVGGNELCALMVRRALCVALALAVCVRTGPYPSRAPG